MAEMAKSPPGRNGYQYREQYGVVVVCRDEKHQQQVFNDLRKAGHKVKVVTV
jgi:hypothetical protein